MTLRISIRWWSLVLSLFALAPWISGEEQPAPPPAIDGIENLQQVAPGLLSGSQPQGPAVFEELARRGVKVIISVDGTAPDVEAAHKARLRYVQIPIGYDKIDPQERADLVEAVKTANGTVFMHCHHGKHRGPTAAAYCGMAIGKLTETEALSILKSAGTRPDYLGLWDAVREFEPPTVAAGPLVESAHVKPLIAAMIRIEHHWTGIDQHVTAGQVEDWKELSCEALVLSEEFRELTRTASSTDKVFKTRMTTAVAATEELHMAAEKNDMVSLKAANQKVLQSCIDCHANHRDQ